MSASVPGSGDDALAVAKAGQARRRAEKVAPIGDRSRAIRREKAVSGVKLAAAGILAVLVASTIWGLVSPIGILGVMLAALAIVAVVVMAVMRTTVPEVRASTLPRTDLKQLAGRAELWLEQQQPLLPAPAKLAAQSIGTRLDQLGLQLDTLDPASPVATEVRSLVGEHLPSLIQSYERVPPPMRGKESAGSTPDQQLTDGLKTIDRQIDDLATRIAQGDLDALATRGRFLEIKYSGEE